MKSPDQAPGNKYSPEQKERIKYLLEIANKDLTSPSLIGFHGASLASLNLLIETGKLFGRPIKSDLADNRGIGNMGDLHFYARAEGFPKSFDHAGLEMALDEMTEETAIEQVTGYAEMNTEREIFMEILGLDQSNQEHRDLFYEFSSPNDKNAERRVNFVYDDPETFRDILNIIKKLGFSKAKMIEFVLKVQKEMLSRKGLIFGLDNKLLSEYKVKIGDANDDLFISCPDGLDYKDICGLRLLGTKEKQFLANLRTQI